MGKNLLVVKVFGVVKIRDILIMSDGNLIRLSLLPKNNLAKRAISYQQ